MSYKMISIERFGGPEVLKIERIEALPEPKEGEVRVKVLATSASFTDTLVRRGIYPDVHASPPLTPGFDMVGIIDKLGEGVTDLAVGQMVAELTITGLIPNQF